jgi:hypothetical protein
MLGALSPSKISQRSWSSSFENLGEIGPVRDLALNVANHTAEHGSDPAQRLVGALELFGVGIALQLDQRQLADPGIGLGDRERGIQRNV